MNTCSNCGVKLSATDAACPGCGQTVGAASAAANPYAPSDALIYDTGEPQPVAHRSPGRRYHLPFGISEVLGAAVGLWVKTFVRLALVMIAPHASLRLVSHLFGMGSGSIRPAGLYIAIALAGTLVTTVLFFTATAAAYLLLDDQLRSSEKKRTVGEALIEGIGYFWRLVGQALLIGLVTTGLMIPALFGIFSGSKPAVLLLMLPALVGIVVLMVRWAVVQQVIVIENAPVIRSLTRSADLVRGNFWSVFGVLFVFFLATSGISWLSLVLALIPVFGQLIGFVVNFLIGNFGICLYFVIYASLRDLRGD